MIIDSHVHVASGDEGRYPRHPMGVGSNWWHHPVDAPGLIGAMDAGAIDRCVAVQAVGAYGYDNSYLLDACAGFPERLVAVPAAADEAQLLQMVSLPQVVGIRCFLVGGVGHDVVKAALEHSPTVVLTGWLPQLTALEGLLSRYPEVPVVVDHCGFPKWGDADDGERLSRLAGLANVSVKFTGHLLHDAPDAAARFSRVVELFGPDRVMAGSDFPQTSADYPGTWAQLRSLGRRPGGEGFLGANAGRVWFRGGP